MPPVDNFTERMRQAYGLMDEAYGAVARHYGFSCEGCGENCCTQRFHHHTLAEYYYLLEGLKAAPPGLQRHILTKARVVAESYKREPETGEALPLMCPVNFDGLCGLYEHRPMICRMHGLPHKFRRPDGRQEGGGGCAPFEAAHATDWTVDRTKGYTALARIELEIRRMSMRPQRYKKTTAEMLLEMWQMDEDLQALMQEDK